MMIGTPPPSFSALAAARGGGAAGRAGRGAGAGASADGGGGGGWAASARKEALVSIPSSAASRVPSRSCQNRCSCTSLYLHEW